MLLRSGGGKRWGWVERLDPFRFLWRYRGVHVSRTWPRSGRHRGRGERGSLRRGRAALRDDLGEGNLKGRGAAHTMGEGLVLEVRVPQDLPNKAQDVAVVPSSSAELLE
jgi:hypothetical protein